MNWLSELTHTLGHGLLSMGGMATPTPTANGGAGGFDLGGLLKRMSNFGEGQQQQGSPAAQMQSAQTPPLGVPLAQAPLDTTPQQNGIGAPGGPTPSLLDHLRNITAAMQAYGTVTPPGGGRQNGNNMSGY